MEIIFRTRDQIDYEKIRVMTHEAVKEEIKNQLNNHHALTKEEIQEAVCAAIIQADEKRVEIEKERIRNTKLSLIAIVTMIVFGCLSVIFAALAIYIYQTEPGVWIDKVAACAKYILFALSFAVMIVVEYTLGKIKDQNFTFNMISIVIAWLSMVIAVASSGGQ